MVWPGSGRLRGRRAGSLQLLCTRGSRAQNASDPARVRGAWKEKQQLGARRDLGAESESHRKGACRVRKWRILGHERYREEPEPESPDCSA